MALTTLSPTPAAGGAVRLDWFTQLIAAINATGNNTDVTYAAGNFFANGSMTWGVDSGDITTNTYWRYEKALEWAFVVDISTVGGTLNTDLRATLPLSLTIAKSVFFPFTYVDNGTFGTGIAKATSGNTYIAFQKAGGANWSAATNNTSVYLPPIKIPTTT